MTSACAVANCCYWSTGGVRDVDCFALAAVAAAAAAPADGLAVVEALERAMGAAASCLHLHHNDRGARHSTTAITALHRNHVKASQSAAIRGQSSPLSLHTASTAQVIPIFIQLAIPKLGAEVDLASGILATCRIGAPDTSWKDKSEPSEREGLLIPGQELASSVAFQLPLAQHSLDGELHIRFSARISARRGMLLGE
eukprot:6178474-Pleurochrysis_carterae.AAC.2